MSNVKEIKRFYRHKRVRKIVKGTEERPRLCVHRSAKNFHAQLIDDLNGKVMLGKSTLAKDVKTKAKSGGNIEGASVLGEIFAAEVLKKGIKRVCFDRGGYLYHGRVKAFADAARKMGLEF